MKLIIDIPEEDYIRLRDEGMFGNVTTFKRAVREGIPLEQEPCEDAISRDKAIVQLSHLLSDWDDDWNVAIRKCIETIKIVPPAAPQYTDAEIQKMQELEQAEIQKAYELGKAEGSSEKVGRWVYNKNLSTHYGDIYTCSECGERCLESCYERIEKLPDFCPKCHIKMEVEK